MTQVRLITHGSKTMPLRAWAAKLGVCHETLRARINRSGVEAAMRMSVPRRRQYKTARPADEIEQEKRRRKAYERKRADGDDLAVCGDALGISKERVRQVELIALARLRIAHELVDLIGVDLAEELLTAMRGLNVTEWERQLSRFRAIAQWAQRKVAA